MNKSLNNAESTMVVKSLREPETINTFWSLIFKYPSATVGVGCSTIAWIMLVDWLNLDEVGGLGARDNRGVTLEYFNWHIFLMGTAFLLFMLPAVMSFEVYPLMRGTNKNIHTVLNTLAFCAAICGLAIILDCHNNLSDKGSFKTVHAVVGLITLICLTLNFLAAFVLYVLKLGGPLRGILKPLHKRAGLSILVMGMFNVCIGLMEKTAGGSYSGNSKANKTPRAIAACVYFAAIGLIFTVSKFIDKKPASHGDFQYDAVPTAEDETGTGVSVKKS